MNCLWWVWLLTGIIISLIGGWVGVVVWSKLKKRPAFKTKHGIAVYTHLNSESKYTTKESLELYIESYIQHLATEGLFSEAKLRECLKGTQLYWKIYPYWNNDTKRLETGNRCDNDIIVGWQPKFERTSLAHEYMHLFLDKIQGNPDAEHRQKQYWKMADGFVGVISY